MKTDVSVGRPKEVCGEGIEPGVQIPGASSQCCHQLPTNWGHLKDLHGLSGALVLCYRRKS